MQTLHFSQFVPLIVLLRLRVSVLGILTNVQYSTVQWLYWDVQYDVAAPQQHGTIPVVYSGELCNVAYMV